MKFKKLMMVLIAAQLSACAHQKVPVEDKSDEAICTHEAHKSSTAKKIIKKVAIGTAVVTGTAIKAVGGVLNYCGRAVTNGAKSQSDAHKKK